MLTRLMLAFLVVLTLLLVVAARVGAAPPAHADPALHDWFESLRVPGTSYSCCGIADCRAVPYRITERGYEALIDGRWVVVPKERIAERLDNPTGQAIACRRSEGPIHLPDYDAGQGDIICFIRPAET